MEDVEATDTKVFVAFGGGYNRFVQFSATGTQEYGSCGDGDVQEVHLVNNGHAPAGGWPLRRQPQEELHARHHPDGPHRRVRRQRRRCPVPVNPTPFSSVYANELGVWEFLGDTLTDIWVAGDFLKVSSRNTGGLAHFFDGQTYTDGQNPSTPTNVPGHAGRRPGASR